MTRLKLVEFLTYPRQVPCIVIVNSFSSSQLPEVESRLIVKVLVSLSKVKGYIPFYRGRQVAEYKKGAHKPRDSVQAGLVTVIGPCPILYVLSGRKGASITVYKQGSMISRLKVRVPSLPVESNFPTILICLEPALRVFVVKTLNLRLRGSN